MKRFLKYHIKDRLILAQQSQAIKQSNEAPILVFTMAKVGSLSVYQSLKTVMGTPIFHVHTLDQAEIDAGLQQCFNNGVYPDSRSPVSLINNEVIKKNRPFKVISLFRNPIERNISAFFDAFEFHIGMPASKYKGDIQTIEDAFHTKLNHRYAIDWYGKHFKNGLGLDIYQTYFDTQKKYQIIKSDLCEILLLDSRLADEKKETLIAHFCNLESFKLSNVNVTSHLKHGALYKQFKSHIRFRESYLDTQLHSTYFNHFFSDQDRKHLVQKWRKD